MPVKGAANVVVLRLIRYLDSDRGKFLEREAMVPSRSRFAVVRPNGNLEFNNIEVKWNLLLIKCREFCEDVATFLATGMIVSSKIQVWYLPQ